MERLHSNNLLIQRGRSSHPLVQPFFVVRSKVSSIGVEAVYSRTKNGVFFTISNFAKKTVFTRENGIRGILGGKAGRLRRRPRSFAGTREISLIFQRELRKTLWSLARGFIRIPQLPCVPGQNIVAGTRSDTRVPVRVREVGEVHFRGNLSSNTLKWHWNQTIFPFCLACD